MNLHDVTVDDVLVAYDSKNVALLADPRPTRCKLRLYFNTLRPVSMAALTPQMVVDWYNENKKRSQVQADACISILRTAIKRAADSNLYIGHNVAKMVQRKSFPRRKRYIFKEERPILIDTIDRLPLMQRLYFYTLYYVGCRPGELQRAQIDDIRLFHTGGVASGIWIKPMTKNGDPQQVPLPTFICDLLDQYLATVPVSQKYLFIGKRGARPSKEWWWGQWRWIVKHATETRGNENVQVLKRVQQRDLRRTCATDLTPHLDLITISKGVLNHRDLNTTQIYVQPINSRIVDAMNRNVEITRAHLQGGHHEQSHSVLQPVSSGVSVGRIEHALEG